jgi:hypothetical protein
MGVASACRLIAPAEGLHPGDHRKCHRGDSCKASCSYCRPCGTLLALRKLVPLFGVPAVKLCFGMSHLLRITVMTDRGELKAGPAHRSKLQWNVVLQWMSPSSSPER